MELLTAIFRVGSTVSLAILTKTVAIYKGRKK